MTASNFLVILNGTPWRVQYRPEHRINQYIAFRGFALRQQMRPLTCTALGMPSIHRTLATVMVLSVGRAGPDPILVAGDTTLAQLPSCAVSIRYFLYATSSVDRVTYPSYVPPRCPALQIFALSPISHVYAEIGQRRQIWTNAL